ncbi:HAMP domain-containing sensor histidine kinase [uncultured Marinobacter sp.]|uniref:sensor histidine kinase n=1 Tax=uncultured Marinobacter sp. TaxID=187379 RepID=UPI0030DB1E9C
MSDPKPPEQGNQPVNLPKLDFSMVIASAVHDMKNSLGMLISTLDDLRTEQTDTDSSGTRLNTLQYEAERVHSDLVQLLGIYRLGEQKLSAHTDEHYVADFLKEQLARHEPLLKGYGVAYDVSADDELTGFFDEELIAGVITSTINNAIRYTRSQILLTARADETGGLVIGIEDDGSGYPEHMQQAGTDVLLKSPDFRTGSTSLGLYFAAAIANLHQNNGLAGKIRLRNGGSLGGGVFEICLP